jgi:hypothetical protein
MLGPIPGRDFGKARMALYLQEARERCLQAICSDNLRQRIGWKLASMYKFLTSFAKSQWRIEDYPLRYCYQDNQKIDLPCYYVEIIGWSEMIGFGDSCQEAYDCLSRRIEKRSLTLGYLPRPGTTVSVESKKTDDELRRLIKGAFAAKISDKEIASMAEVLRQFTSSVR